MMKRYEVVISYTEEVEAKDKESAEKIFEDAMYQGKIDLDMFDIEANLNE